MDTSDLERAISALRRMPVLDACRETSLSRKQLAEHTSLSRTTVYRATVALEEQGLLEQTAAGYRTTSKGATLSAAGETYVAAVEAIDHLEPLIALVDDPELVDHAHLLEDATLVVSDASNPYRVVDRVIERLEETTTSRGTITSVTALEAMQRANSSLESVDHIERIFAASALEAHETIGGDEFREVTASDAVSILVADDASIPFSFSIDDDEMVTIVGHDPATGLPTVYVESGRSEARTWLEAVYDRCRADATPF
ncbi:helix-turn-helix transcriptional regulator [Natrarchaeobius sp. A-rgal3]|uniref:helix-turn-helix transcriptional regulator n=1 Tax=Natrarchaeobius versutus TaxID=1679078 RepID=UPI0035102000